MPAEARLRAERAEEMELQHEVLLTMAAVNMATLTLATYTCRPAMPPPLPHQVLRGADVVCCQMISAGGDFLGRLGPFKGILVDEVAQVYITGLDTQARVAEPRRHVCCLYICSLSWAVD